MSYHAVLTALTKVPKAAKTSQLTIAEGHTRQYVAALLRKQKIKGDYVAETRHSKLLDPTATGRPRTLRRWRASCSPTRSRCWIRSRPRR